MLTSDQRCAYEPGRNTELIVTMVRPDAAAAGVTADSMR